MASSVRLRHDARHSLTRKSQNPNPKTQTPIPVAFGFGIWDMRFGFCRYIPLYWGPPPPSGGTQVITW
jgi:hypothetical protein